MESYHMQQKLDDSVAEMRRLYEVEHLTLQEMGERFHVSKQAVHYRCGEFLVNVSITRLSRRR